jgi:hypothetical protein
MSSHRAAARPLRKAAAQSSAIVTEAPPAGADESEEARALAADIERALSTGRRDVLTNEALQDLMAAACKLYAAKAEAGELALPCGPHHGVSATDAMATASGLLRAVNLAVFELGMWQSWTGR